MCMICNLTRTFDPARHMTLDATRANGSAITVLDAASGNPYIDGLTLEPGRPTPVIYTPGSTITYVFDTDARPWTEAEKAAVRAAWDAWDRLINLDIAETTDRAQATVLMQISPLDADVAAQASTPGDNWTPAINQTNVNGGALDHIGMGGDSYLTFLHEIGHNLGLFHPHHATTFPGIADGEEMNSGTHGANQHVFTVMGYVAGWDRQPLQDLSFGGAMTPMAFDIAAVQFAYGAAPANTGDDLYLLPSVNEVGTGWSAIWDTGGTDTISAQGTAAATTIDLRAASLDGDRPGGHVSWTGGIVGGVTIANGVVIENAVGGGGNDTIIGNSAGNALVGGDGDDIFIGGGGNDAITGGDGADIARFSAAKSGVTIALTASGTIEVTDRNGQDGTDTLRGVERAQFSDSVLDFDQFAGTASLTAEQFVAVTEMYTAYFNRAADAEGLYFWADKMADGLTMRAMAEIFFHSDESRGIYADPDDSHAFVTSIYANLLGRAPDAGGFEFWRGKLETGAISHGTFVLEAIGVAQAAGGVDSAFLDAKTDLSLQFAAIRGMSDAADARDVFTIFGDAATANLAGARQAVERHHAEATAPGGGDFLFTLVGVVDDPFATMI